VMEQFAPSKSNRTGNPSSYRKLPDLPTYSGEVAKWPLFKAELEQTTEQWNISDVENMSRLRKCLKGDALEAVQSLMVHPDNLPELISTLRLRFGRVETIIENAIEQVKKVPPIKERHFDSVVSFSCIVSNTVVTIKSFGEKHYLTNPILQKEMVSKLPTSLCMTWLDFAEEVGSSNIEEFSKWLTRKAKTLAAGISFSPSPATASTKENTPERKRGKCKVLATGDPATEDKPSSPKPKKCKYCTKDGHKLQECRKFCSEPDEPRIKFIKENHLCFGCLNYGHSIDQCRSKKPCPISGCQISHHELPHELYNFRHGPEEKEL